MIEMVLIFIILSGFTVIFLNSNKITNTTSQLVIPEYLYYQSNAMAELTTQTFQGVIFNASGNVNKAQSLFIHNKTFIVSLGSGKIYEK